MYAHANGNVLAAYDYTVRADGKRTALDETIWFDANEDGIQTAGELKTTSTSWTYDAVGRLTDEVLDHWDNTIDRAEHFEYDLTGNRKTLASDLNLDGIIDELVTDHYLCKGSAGNYSPISLTEGCRPLFLGV